MAYRLLLRNITLVKPVYRPILPALQHNCLFSEKSVIPVTESLSLDTPVSVKELNGLPPNHVSRYAIIFKPARCAMQSGTKGTHNWRIEFETQQRWENPVMGWASSGDPLSNMVLDFSSKEAAMNFAMENGWKYKVKEPAVVLPRKKTYAENFSWNKNTRVSNK